MYKDPRPQEDCRRGAGFDVWRFARDVSVPGIAMHEDGTARMGSDPRTSVLNGFCQSWDVHNLFVMGASLFPHNSAYNPTGPVGALAYRAADIIVGRYIRNPGALVSA